LLEKNTKFIFLKKDKELVYAIKKSCEIKTHFVTKDLNEKGLRMILNFGHTFAHAIEIKNNFSKKITHGEAVLSGMILAIKLSILKKKCSHKILNQVLNLYKKNNLTYLLKNLSNAKWIQSLIPFLKQDKKNDDDKINFLLLKNIGKTEMPNKFKISTTDLRKYCKTISQY
jgi:3-dehydroquinate synthetase